MVRRSCRTSPRPTSCTGRSRTKRLWMVKRRAELMEDAFHCSSNGLVVGVDWFWVVRSAGWAEWLSRGEEWFDSFVSENEGRGHCPQTRRERLVATGMADPADDLFATKFPQIVGGMSGAIL